MTELTLLLLALSLAAPLALRMDGRYLAAAAGLALIAYSLARAMPVGLLVGALALAISLDGRTGAMGIALAFSAVGTAVAAYAYYFQAGPQYAIAALALVTAAVYGLLAAGRRRENLEGAAKYVVFSGAGKVLIVVGYVLAGVAEPQGLAVAALGFLLELGVVPFHVWMVDAYALGSPRGVAALAAFGKLTAVYALLSLFAGREGQIGLVLTVAALASMLVANVAGLTARTLGRAMAYSSIAHMSYALAAVGLAAWMGSRSFQLFGLSLDLWSLAAAVAVLEALTTAVSKAGIFSAVTTPYADLPTVRRSVANSVNLLSLLGMPPLLGFWPKLLLILMALPYGALGAFVAVWVVLNSAVATVYYLRAIRAMAEAPGPSADGATAWLTALLSIALGIAVPLALGIYAR